jgi:Protein of unknown function (DUF3108)
MRVRVALAMALVLSTVVSGQQPRQPGARTPAPRTPAAKPPPRPAPPPAREASVPFRVGETLTYDVSWSQFLTAGTAVSRVVEKKPSSGSAAYAIVADGRPVPLVARFYPVYYKMESLLDSFNILSLATSSYSEENGRKRQSNTRFDRGARRAYYEASTDAAKVNFEIPANVQDGLATLYAVRGHAFKAGERFTIPVADDGSLYRVEFETRGQERVRVPMGDLEAWSLKLTILDDKGQPAATNTAVWVSTDARRLPIKLQSDLSVGSFVLALRDAQP